MLQVLAGAELLSVVETHHRDPTDRIFTAQGLHKGQVVQGAQVPQASPAVRRHFYSTVIVGGAAKWWWFAATWWLTTRAGLIHLKSDGWMGQMEREKVMEEMQKEKKIFKKKSMRET